MLPLGRSFRFRGSGGDPVGLVPGESSDMGLVSGVEGCAFFHDEEGAEWARGCDEELVAVEEHGAAASIEGDCVGCAAGSGGPAEGAEGDAEGGGEEVQSVVWADGDTGAGGGAPESGVAEALGAGVWGDASVFEDANGGAEGVAVGEPVLLPSDYWIDDVDSSEPIHAKCGTSASFGDDIAINDNVSDGEFIFPSKECSGDSSDRIGSGDFCAKALEFSGEDDAGCELALGEIVADLVEGCAVKLERCCVGVAASEGGCDCGGEDKRGAVHSGCPV